MDTFPVNHPYWKARYKLQEAKDKVIDADWRRYEAAHQFLYNQHHRFVMKEFRKFERKVANLFKEFKAAERKEN